MNPVKLPGRRKPHNKLDKTLRWLLHTARQTEFGKQYRFSEILSEGTVSAFQENVPLANHTLLRPWWERARAGETNLCWPGRILYFAISSGTTESRQKLIPVSQTMIRVMNRGYRNLAETVLRHSPLRHIATQALCIGSSSRLHWNGASWTGDISGISAARMPAWFGVFYKPGQTINRISDWGEKLEQIVKQAPRWNIGTLTGLPSSVLQVLEAVVVRYRLATIHDLWPALRVFCHSGIPYDHYHPHFQGLLRQPLLRFETLTASEGLIGLPAKANSGLLRLLTDNGIFFEFIPFNSTNFDDAGQPKSGCNVYTADELIEHQPYALVLSTCSGLWRYLIGDVIEFENVARLEFRFAGRTSAWLNLAAEKVSESLLAKAISILNAGFDARILEFTIIPCEEKGQFYHHWIVGTESNGQEHDWEEMLDRWLCASNIDYETARKDHLGRPRVTVIPPELFARFLEQKGSVSGQQKIPRVLSTKDLELLRRILHEAGFSLVLSTITYGNQRFTSTL